MDQLLVEERDAVVWVTLNRPEVRNAISLALRVELADRLVELAERPDLRVLVLAGAGEAFCAGGDVTELARPRTEAEAARRVAEGNRMVLALHDFPVPTIAAVHGAVAGAGCSLALACDLTVAATSAVFRLAFVHLGLGPDAGASALLPARVGAARAKEMFFLGAPMTAARAQAAGLVNRVVPDDRLRDEVAELAAAVGRQSRPALVATKRLVNARLDLAEVLDRELAAQVGLLATAEHREARDQFPRRTRKEGHQ